MSEELYTVEQAAERLKLHAKTVLRAIREERLRATRVGKSYRILKGDLDAFAGVPARTASTAGGAWITTIVDLPGVGAELAQRWARMIPGGLGSRAPGGPPLRAEVIYEPERSHLKLVIVGPAADVVALTSLIGVWIEQL